MSRKKSGMKAAEAFGRLDDGTPPPQEVVAAFERMAAHQAWASEKWPSLYGIDYPSTIEEWFSLAYRAGVPREWPGRPLDDFTIRELEPRIRGYLESLRDNRSSAEQHDTKDDKQRKSRKKLRELNVEAADCIRRYKETRRRDPTMSMHNVVCEYVDEMGKGSVDGIMRRLNDHPKQWKDDKKTT